MKKVFLLAIICMLFAEKNFAQQQSLCYPKTLKVDTVDDYFGVKVADPYRWLENDTSAATAAWVKAQNKVTNDYLSRIPFHSKLLRRLTELANYESVSSPMKKFGKFYYFKNNGLQNQSVMYVKDSSGSEPRVFLDPNKLSSDGTVALQGTSFSNDGKYMAYIISRSGSDWEEIYVMDVATGKQLGDHITWAKFTNASWFGDGFFYSAYDAPEKGKEYSSMNENHKLYFHQIGTPQTEDKLIYQNPSYPKRFYYATVDKKETMIFLNEGGDGNGNTLFVKDLTKKDAQFVRMTDDNNLLYFPIYTEGAKIYIYTNYKAPKYRIMTADMNNPYVTNWKELIPESENVISATEVIGGKLFLTYSKDASDHAVMYSLKGEKIRDIHLPSLGSVNFSGEEDQPDCFYSFSSYTMPTTIYKYDISTGSSVVFHQPKVAFDTNDFVTEQIFFKSKDGTRVPMFVNYKKGMRRNGKNPLLIYGYGGFDINLTPSFSTLRIPFMENGGIYVEVNLRGGGEYGEEWHLAGTKMKKQNVFDDFICAAEYLIANKYTNKTKLAMEGGSNGGLLVGACMTQRPDLYKVAIARVGVMDMLRYHKFTIGWNWAGDYGTSSDSKEMFEYLKGYSPLHNLKKGVHYPATIVTTADHDDRVVPAHSFKFAATLQECNAGKNPTLIRIDSKAGHGGGKPVAKKLQEAADMYSFMMYNLGMPYVK
jgi:prolyl oligopeptidase